MLRFVRQVSATNIYHDSVSNMAGLQEIYRPWPTRMTAWEPQLQNVRLRQLACMALRECVKRVLRPECPLEFIPFVISTIAGM